MGRLDGVRPLQVGGIAVWPPVVLAPMAGITTSAFRRLCREFAVRESREAGPGHSACAEVRDAERDGRRGPDHPTRSDAGQPPARHPLAAADGGPRSPLDARSPAGHGSTSAGLFVSEMITSRALVERNEATLQMIGFAADETPRSLQLYGVDPKIVGQAVAMVADEDRADHIDLNFGCPVPKVTRKGGGSALPVRRGLLREIVRAAVANAQGRPVTVKIRKGIDDELLTYLDAGRIAEDEGAAAVALHGRTAAQMYGGTADWRAIATLKAAVGIPVLGNGDLWTADDALRMMAETGCDGVVVGRGCLGRPWLFGDLVAAFAGRPQPQPPRLGEVAAVLRRHATLLADEMGETRAMRDLRKHVAWYLKGFRAGSDVRSRLGVVESFAQLDDLLARLDPAEPFPADVAAQPRGRTTPQRRVVLPEGWLDFPDACDVPVGAEQDISGG